MVRARLGDGQTLLALNEIFVGHRTHQSARYRIAFGGRAERHSSSGLIVATGTGATGWAKSIAHDRRAAPALPEPLVRELAFLVREAWASVTTGDTLTDGRVARGRDAARHVGDERRRHRVRRRHRGRSVGAAVRTDGRARLCRAVDAAGRVRRDER